MTVIVKVQRSIYPPDLAECLVYERKKTFMSHQLIPDYALKAMCAREGLFAFKAHFEAEWDARNGVYIIGKMLENEPW